MMKQYAYKCGILLGTVGFIVGCGSNSGSSSSDTETSGVNKTSSLEMLDENKVKSEQLTEISKKIQEDISKIQEDISKILEEVSKDTNVRVDINFSGNETLSKSNNEDESWKSSDENYSSGVGAR